MTESNEETQIGRIELIMGPMFSGKSTRLIDNIRKSAYKAKKAVMISYYADKRYTKKSEVVTHDLIKYDSIECKNLSEKFEILKQYDIVGIDEGQFFKDLIEICEKLSDMGKIVIVAALNGDFRREPFPVIADLVPKVDKIKLLTAYCFNCHKEAKYSLRIVNSNEKILIGAGESYKPACRKCFHFFEKAKRNGNYEIIEEAMKKSNETIEASKNNDLMNE